MRLGRVAWLLPAIAVATIVAQLAYLLETRQLSWTGGILVGVLDILFVLLVVRLFHALGRDEPLTLSMTLFGMFGLQAVAGVVGGSGLIGAVGFVLTAWAWARHGCRPEGPGLRRWLGVVLLGGLTLWVTVFFAGLVPVRDAVAIRAAAAVGLVVPIALYVHHVAGRLKDRVRISDGVLLLGIFIVLPAIYVGPGLILDRREAYLLPAMVALYYDLFAFVGIAVAWSKGSAPGGSEARHLPGGASSGPDLPDRCSPGQAISRAR